MHILSFLLAAVAATVTAIGYQIDPNQEDGVYFIPHLTKSALFQRSEALYGHPIRMADLDFPPSPSNLSESGVNGSVPLPTDSHKCFKATEEPWSFDGAKATLSKWCDEGQDIPNVQKFGQIAGLLLARYGSSIAYACNWGNLQGCAINEIEDAWSHISDNCGGKHQGGQVCMMHKWKKCYGHSTIMGMICENGI